MESFRLAAYEAQAYKPRPTRTNPASPNATIRKTFIQPFPQFFATGLALTILGIGLSGLIGSRFVGEKISLAPHLYIPGLTDIPLVGRILFGEDAFVYLSLALVTGVWFFLYRTRAGLILRAAGDNHASAHALGYPVLRIRMFAVMFGGACAGLAGAYLPLAYTPFFIPGMTAGRGWIALALVVFASWLPGRLVIYGIEGTDFTVGAKPSRAVTAAVARLARDLASEGT